MKPSPTDAPCARVRARLPELLDGALTPLEEARDLGHLEACTACGREHAQFTRTLAGVHALARVAAEELAGEHAAILARLAPRARRSARDLRPHLVAAAALLLFVLGAWFGLPRAPRAEDLDHWGVLSGLSDWDGLLKGLEDLTRRFS